MKRLGKTYRLDFARPRGSADSRSFGSPQTFTAAELFSGVGGKVDAVGRAHDADDPRDGESDDLRLMQVQLLHPRQICLWIRTG